MLVFHCQALGNVGSSNHFFCVGWMCQVELCFEAERFACHLRRRLGRQTLGHFPSYDVLYVHGSFFAVELRFTFLGNFVGHSPPRRTRINNVCLQQ